MPQQYRYGSTIKNYRKITNTVATDATSVSRSGPQLLRHSQKAHPWIGQNINQVIDADVPYTGTGQDIDIIVVDNGVRIAHPEFVNSIVARAKNPSGYVGGNVLGGYCDVLDVVLDFPYWIDPTWFNADPGNRLETRWDGTTVPKDLAARQWWSSETFRSPGVAPPGGITIPVNYTRLNSCGNETQKPLDGSHGTPVASCVYGRTQGWAFNANKWVIWLDAFTDNYDRVFLIQQVFHQFKPTNVAKGNRNPTISVNSWEFLNALDGNGGYLHYRGTRYPFDAPDQRYNWIPYMNGIRFYAGAAHSAEMKTNSVTTRAADCVNAGVIFVAAAGNTNQQLVDSSHPNYDNYWSLTGEGGFEGNTNTFAGVVPGGVEYYNSLNRRGFPAQAGSFIQSGQRTYPVILVGSIGTYVPTGTTTYAREYKDDTSSYGDAVDCFATGEDVLAANHVNGTGILRWDNELLTNATTYEDRNISGTSFAAPTAAGLIACKIETNRTWNYSNIKSWLLNSCGRATNSQIYGVESFASAEDLKWEDRYRINSTLPPVIIWNADNTASLNPSPIYSWDTIPNPINEGASATFVVNTVNVANGTTLYWIITSNAGDFTVSSGSFTINNSTGSFSVSPTADQITEGEETFTLRVRSESINGTTVLTVFNILINDTSTTPAQTYSFSSTPASINEGTAGTFNVSTANVNDGTTLYWTIDSNAGDFTITSGNFTINSGAGNFSITPTADILTEGQETFTVNVRTGSITGPVVLTASSVIINDTSTTPVPTYTITPTSLTIAEGSSLLFNVTTTNVANGTTLWWFINNTTTTNSDFTSVSGSFTITSNSGSFDVVLVRDNLTEGLETFSVSIRATSNINDPVLVTSSSITTSPPTYSIIPVSSSVNEGSSLTFTVTTTNVANGTTLYWFVNNVTTINADFPTTSGSVTINNGSGNFNVSVSADQLTEGGQVFNITLRANSNINDPVLATSSNITVNDTSTTPTPPSPTYNITSNSSSINEGSSLTFTVTTANIANGTTLFWFINHITTNAADFSANSGSFVMNSGSGTFSISSIADSSTEGNQTFRIDIRDTNNTSGSILGSSITLTLNDTSKTPVINPITTINSLTNNIWMTPDVVGELEMFQTSELSIKTNISKDLGLNLVYEKINGDLPTGITLLRDGTLQGAALIDSTTINTTTNYTFTVAISKSVGNPISTATFTLVVNRTDAAIYTPVYIKPFLKQETKKFIRNFLFNKSIFKPSYIYRPFDKNFGIQKELRSYLHYAIERVEDLGLQDLSNLFFYKKRFLIGPPKFAIAKDKFGKHIYDAIYSDVIDYSVNNQGESPNNTGLLPSEPFTYANVRNRFELRGFLRGYETNRFNPRFMQTVQKGYINELGFIPCIVWAYVLPDKGNLVIDSIKQNQISFNNIDFEIDRFIIERSSIAEDSKYFIFGGTSQFS